MSKPSGKIFVKSITSGKGSVTLFDQKQLAEQQLVQPKTKVGRNLHIKVVESTGLATTRNSFIEQYRSKEDPSQQESNAAFRIISKSPSVAPNKSQANCGGNVSVIDQLTTPNNGSSLGPNTPTAFYESMHDSTLKLSVYPPEGELEQL